MAIFLFFHLLFQMDYAFMFMLNQNLNQRRQNHKSFLIQFLNNKIFFQDLNGYQGDHFNILIHQQFQMMGIHLAKKLHPSIQVMVNGELLLAILCIIQADSSLK